MPAAGDDTPVRIHMVNTGEVATATVATPGGRVSYAGDAAIDGVPGTAARGADRRSRHRRLDAGALLPTGNAVDVIDGVEVTLIDNGMPAWSCAPPTSA